MAEAASEEHIRELVARMQVYEARLDSLQQQANLVQMSINEVDGALKSLTAMESMKDGHEMMVPIGAGSYIFANARSTDKVLVGLGAGVSLEKDVAGSKEIFNSRRTELEKLLVDATAEINHMANELMKLQQEAQKYR